MDSLYVFNLRTEICRVIGFVFKQYARDFVFYEVCWVVDVV